MTRDSKSITLLLSFNNNFCNKGKKIMMFECFKIHRKKLVRGSYKPIDKGVTSIITSRQAYLKIGVSNCSLLTLKNTYNPLWIELSFEMCGCFSGHFSCSPTSTNKIYATKLVLH